MLFDIGYPDKIMPVLAVPEKPVPMGQGWGKNKGGKGRRAKNDGYPKISLYL